MQQKIRNKNKIVKTKVVDYNVVIPLGGLRRFLSFGRVRKNTGNINE